MRRSVLGFRAATAVLAGALALAAVSAQANLVTNGSFESNGGNGQLSYNSYATGWTVPAPNDSYTFIFAPYTADTTGAAGEYGNVSLWGPGNGSNNGMPPNSPDGGYFIGSDPSFQNGTISQSIGGLRVGGSYSVTFFWAAAQQYLFSGPTTEGWQVSLGSETKSTNIVNLPSEGFSGWFKQSFTFTADNSTDVLAFLALGGPNGSVPPFALLDGVSMNAVPEPATWAVLLAGLVTLGGFAWRRRNARRNSSGIATA